jgi:hypothetical protein
MTKSTLNAILKKIKDVWVSRSDELYQFVLSLTARTKPLDTYTALTIGLGSAEKVVRPIRAINSFLSFDFLYPKFHFEGTLIGLTKTILKRGCLYTDCTLSVQ